MSTLRKLGVGLAVIAGLLFAAGMYYSLPRAVKATVTGTDVKRMDVGTDAQGRDKSRDIRFVYAERLSNKEAMVFRNEDTGWGFPFYFKFDSGTIAAKATNLTNIEKGTVVVISYYGIRLPMFDAFPNIISMKEVSPDYVHLPIFSIIFVIVFFAIVIFAYIKIRKLFRAVGDKTKKLVGRAES